MYEVHSDLLQHFGPSLIAILQPRVCLINVCSKILPIPLILFVDMLQNMNISPCTSLYGGLQTKSIETARNSNEKTFLIRVTLTSW